MFFDCFVVSIGPKLRKRMNPLDRRPDLHVAGLRSRSERNREPRMVADPVRLDDHLARDP